MKIVVLSDTHGDAEVISTVFNQEQDADVFFHCGDSELSYNDDHFNDMIRVKGNCDFDNDFEHDIIVNLDDRKVFITHGHLYDIKTSLAKVSEKAQETGVDFVFFGHSHLLGAEVINDVLFLNPGSLTLPRGGNDKSYATIEWEEDEEDMTVFFKTPDKKIISKHLFSILKK